jgi:glucose/mannose-6-phosphate isomerase
MLSANARYPVVAGSLGEAGRGRVGLIDGIYGGLVESERDIYADDDTGVAATRLRVLLLRDGGLEDDNAGAGEPSVVEDRRADAVVELAARRGVRCGVIQAEGGSPLERLASLIAVPDFASVYLALAHGLDPTAVPAVDEMKEFTRR